MNLLFQKMNLPADRDRLIRFLTSEPWPFHVNHRLDIARVETLIDDGLFDGNNHESHWILDSSRTVLGLIRISDLDDVDDGYPLFDLRILSAHRGRGIGLAALEWLIDYLFTKYPGLDRIAGTTRVDNQVMRRLFEKCYFAKEGHYRKDWPSADGRLLDTVKYCLLREDWTNKIVTPVGWIEERF